MPLLEDDPAALVDETRGRANRFCRFAVAHEIEPADHGVDGRFEMKIAQLSGAKLDAIEAFCLGAAAGAVDVAQVAVDADDGPVSSHALGDEQRQVGEVGSDDQNAHPGGDSGACEELLGEGLGEGGLDGGRTLRSHATILARRVD